MNVSQNPFCTMSTVTHILPVTRGGGGGGGGDDVHLCSPAYVYRQTSHPHTLTQLTHHTTTCLSVLSCEYTTLHVHHVHVPSHNSHITTSHNSHCPTYMYMYKCNLRSSLLHLGSLHASGSVLVAMRTSDRQRGRDVCELLTVREKWSHWKSLLRR